MSTHNICFYGELEKNIQELSPNTPPQEVLWRIALVKELFFSVQKY